MPPTQPGFDIDGARRRLSGNAALLVELLRTFAMEHADCAAEVETLLCEGKLATAAAALHRIKSAARIIGAESLATTAESLERDIRHGRPVDTTAFASGLSDVVDIIGRHAGRVPPARDADRSDANPS
ncbi:MAG TPA: Hpt domain-containing protein [Casimicrobiaceae bacterium]